MINYPAVSADWQTLTGSRPTMCLLAGLLHHGFFSPISRSNNNLSSRLIKSSRWRLLLLFFFLTFAEFLSTTRTPVTQVLTIPVGESLCGLWEPPPGPPHPAAGGLKLRPRSLDAPTQTQTTTCTNMSRVDVCCTRGIKQADVKAHMAAFSRRRPLASF